MIDKDLERLGWRWEPENDLWRHVNTGMLLRYNSAYENYDVLGKDGNEIAYGDSDFEAMSNARTKLVAMLAALG